MVESAGTASRNASVMSQLEDTSRELKECYERFVTVLRPVIA